jgi:predicted porin
MKKTLVALAALASVTAFAQTTVSITGNVDVAGVRLSGTMTGAKGTTFSQNLGTGSTSSINFTATEDIGGGTKITGFYGIDPRNWTNDGLASTMNAASTASMAQSVTVTGLARHESYIQASGGFGSIKLGAPNAPSLDAHGVSSPLGTGIGSGHSHATDTLTTRLSTARYSRSARYDTPTMNGLTGSFTYAPGADVDGSETAGGLYVVRQLPNARRATEVSLRYSNGPLNVMIANVTTAYQTYQLGWYAASQVAADTTALASLGTKSNLAGINYSLGSTTLYAGMGSGGSRATTTAATKSDLSRYAIKHSMGQIDLIAQMTTVADTTVSSGAKVSQKVQGLRADYNLSKTAVAYLGYEKLDTGTVASTANTTSGTRTLTSIGLRKSF